jgi:hypothetical protein
MIRPIQSRVVIAIGAGVLVIIGLSAVISTQMDRPIEFPGSAVLAPQASAETSPTAGGSTRWASWELVSTSSDGKTLEIGVTVGGGCERIEDVEVVESAVSVTITPIVSTGLAEACADSLQIVRRSVPLETSVDGRVLVHGEPQW